MAVFETISNTDANFLKVHREQQKQVAINNFI